MFLGMAAGSFSYKNTTINGLNIGNGMQIRVEAINNNVVSMIVTDVNGNPQPIPANITLTDAAGAIVPPWNNVFLLTWIDSYTLCANNEKKKWMTNQKQQAFRTATSVEHVTI